MEDVKTKMLECKARFKTAPEELYSLFMDSDKHSRLIGSSAVISSEVGGEFVVFDGYITGENIELVPGEKIVQKWRDKTWPAGHYSTLTIELRANRKGGTEVYLRHDGIPEDSYEFITNGWKEYYWRKIK